MRRIPALIAIFATALNALWPLIAQAQPKDPLLVAVICSSEGGAHAVDLSGKAPGGAGNQADHCKLCIAGGIAVLTANSPVVAVRFAATSHSGNFTEVLFHTLSASPAPPRGPPSIL